SGPRVRVGRQGRAIPRRSGLRTSGEERTMATRRRYIDLPDHARRNFIKWSIGLGAALGLRPWKVFEVTESVIGPAAAQTASTMPVNRFIGNVMGNAGIAWMSQLFPHAAV